MTTAPTESAGVDLPTPYTMATGFALYTADQMREMYQRGLSARPLPSDWVAVPREATDAMLSAWLTSSEKAGGKSGGDFAPWSRAIRCYRAMLAAAPSAPAEGGEHREIIPVGPEDGWCKRCGCGNDAANFAHLPSCNAKTPDVAARAREILIGLNQGFLGCKRDNEIITKGNAYDVFVRGDIALRALEQALTQQRGECEAVYQFRDAYGAWRDTTKAHYDIETSLDRRTLYTPPQPSASVREDGNG